MRFRIKKDFLDRGDESGQMKPRAFTFLYGRGGGAYWMARCGISFILDVSAQSLLWLLLSSYSAQKEAPKVTWRRRGGHTPIHVPSNKVTRICMALAYGCVCEP